MTAVPRMETQYFDRVDVVETFVGCDFGQALKRWVHELVGRALVDDDGQTSVWECNVGGRVVAFDGFDGPFTFGVDDGEAFR